MDICSLFFSPEIKTNGYYSNIYVLAYVGWSYVGLWSVIYWQNVTDVWMTFDCDGCGFDHLLHTGVVHHTTGQSLQQDIGLLYQ